MRRAKAVVLLSCIVSACHAKESQKPADAKAVLACMAAQNSHDDYLLVTKCEPLGPPKTFHGTWFVGFEMSVFRMNYTGVPADLGSPFDDYDIVVPTSLNERFHAKDSGPSAYQVTFQGRERLLLRKPGEKQIVADRMLAIRAVPVNASVPRLRT